MHTTRERALPGLEVFRNLRHLDIGIEFFDLVHYGVLVVVFIVVPPLLSRNVTSLGQFTSMTRTLSFGMLATSCLSWPREMESIPPAGLPALVPALSWGCELLRNDGIWGKDIWARADRDEVFGKVVRCKHWRLDL